ncbi:putative protein [Arabidopsis thaliana]|uniref:Uncharacterized protein AT4g20950 n=1 Tax=Arabidopsis thaliana TaxID=3702 RepID=Q9SUB8_ARATH|nr:putative protein [Arabidopsis thaliana]CAB79095.1 putative protein [Arabidopsis thaliana]
MRRGFEESDGKSGIENWGLALLKKLVSSLLFVKLFRSPLSSSSSSARPQAPQLVIKLLSSSSSSSSARPTPRLAISSSLDCKTHLPPRLAAGDSSKISLKTTTQRRSKVTTNRLHGAFDTDSSGSGSKTTTSIPGRASHSTSSFDIAACSPTRKGLQGTIDPIILGDDTSSRAVRTITLTDEEVPPIKEEHPITSINIPTSLSLTPNQEQEEKSSGGRHLENLDDDTPSSAARTITSAHGKTQIKNTTRRHLLYRPRYRPRLNT